MQWLQRSDHGRLAAVCGQNIPLDRDLRRWRRAAVELGLPVRGLVHEGSRGGNRGYLESLSMKTRRPIFIFIITDCDCRQLNEDLVN